MTADDLEQRIEATPVSYYGLALRLRRGASDVVCWSCDRASMRGTLSIGSDPACDWTVRGPGIAPVELYVKAPDGRLRVKSARPGEGVRVDGQVLGDGWVILEPGSHIEFGFACLALEFDAAPLGGDDVMREAAVEFLGTPLPDAAGKTPAPSFKEINASDPTPTVSSLGDISISQAPKKERRDATLPGIGTSQPHVYTPTMPTPVRPRPEGEVKGRVREAADVFRGPPVSSRRGAVALYGFIALLTLCAYGGWLFLLERM